MNTIVKKSFASPDEVYNPKKTMKLEILDVGEGLKLQRNTAQPGYHGEDCPYDHVLYVVSGTFHVRMPGGNEIEFGPGEVGVIPAGHDLRVTSSEPAVWLEIKR
ncbi:MAG: cupin domain-containing protein [Candidatus Sungbacteria bacterium]|nr:cupin domain-containing protein [bacterium]MDZ4286178.1 cupin domain-containing protein [Candidatus Sungbacteria bacterium]